MAVRYCMFSRGVSGLMIASQTGANLSLNTQTKRAPAMKRSNFCMIREKIMLSKYLHSTTFSLAGILDIGH